MIKKVCLFDGNMYFWNIWLYLGIGHIPDQDGHLCIWPDHNGVNGSGLSLMIKKVCLFNGIVYLWNFWLYLTIGQMPDQDGHLGVCPDPSGVDWSSFVLIKKVYLGLGIRYF